MSRIINGMSESRYTTVVTNAESEHTSIMNPVLTKYRISTLIAEFVCLNGERALYSRVASEIAMTPSVTNPSALTEISVGKSEARAKTVSERRVIPK